jgi:flavin-dependent dehydrogenase
MRPERREVVVVGGGPAGAAVATQLARARRDVLLLERAPAWRWRACGVFTSPATVAELRRLGLGDATLEATARPIPAMRVEAGTTAFRLTYGARAESDPSAVGLDRSALDPALLSLARSDGAEVRTGTGVRSLAGDRVELDGGSPIEARVVVGADGIRSTVARSVGVARPARLAPRVGLTFHVAAPDAGAGRDARMVVLDHAYCGLAPVPGGRVNVGIVLGPTWRDELRRDGAEAVVGRVLGRIAGWPGGERCDPIEGAVPIGHRVTRSAGDGWLLVGDAAGFLDPFTGEGLHRALVSARLAAAAIDDLLRGRASSLAPYDRTLRARFASKDFVSLVVQGFFERPATFGYAARRFASRTGVRETMGLVMGDLVPASRALDLRFLGALLRP